MDFHRFLVAVGRTLNLIAGDGQTNVLHLNTLDFERWDEKTKDEEWSDIYGDGWKKLRKLRTTKDENRDFEFDVLMANPPFAGDIKETRILSKYELGKKDNGKYQTNVGRDILFIERNLSFLKAGGRMAVVLPQGRFNNSSDKQIREFIAARCRILAVVGLHGNVFKPHTGTKTSVLFVQKWTDDDGICPRKDDYPIFFATMQEPSKDNSGDKIYQMQTDGFPLLDSHGHLIVKHDLFNHDGLTQGGIAEAFVEFAKKENLSFFDSSSFDEVKYRALLEGLEISEVMLSYVLNQNDIFRFDSNYFQQKFLQDETVIRKKEYTTLKTLGVDIRSFGAYSLNNEVTYLDKGIPFIRGVNMKKGRISFSDMIFIDERANSLLWKSEVKPEMILLSMSGTIGDVAIASKSWSYPMNSNQDIAKIETKGKINAYFLYSFLMSKFGQNYLKREARGSVQQHVFLSQIEQFEVPIFSSSLDNAIQNTIEQSDDLLFRSNSCYSQAENLLLDALGMADFSPSNENINIKSFKDSFLTTGRLDAEYYQPKYEEMITSIKKLPCKNLDDVIESYSTGYPYKSDDYLENTGIPLIRINNIKKGFLDLSNTAYLPIEQKEISKNDIAVEGDILLSMSGTIGNSCVIPENVTALINQRIMRFTPKGYNPTVLMLILNSIVGAYQLERVGTGGVQTNISSNDINKIIIPILPVETQTQIASLVQQSFALKAESETLLDLAKRAVEMAIEIDEAAAMSFIEIMNFGE